MWNLICKRILRSPIPALGVLLFAVAIAVVLQSLDQSKLEAQEYYREIYNQIDVTCTVTDLRGTKSDGLYLSNLMVGEFTEAMPWAKEQSGWSQCFAPDGSAQMGQRRGKHSFPRRGRTDPEETGNLPIHWQRVPGNG